MQRTIDETNYRRDKQAIFNKANGIEPKALNKKIEKSALGKSNATYAYESSIKVAAEPDNTYMAKSDIEKIIREKRKAMEKAAKDLDFMEAARLRDRLFQFQKEKDAMK